MAPNLLYFTIMSLSGIISIVQIVISFLLVAAILLQQRGAGLSESLGGFGGSYHTKRGLEKILFISTIVLSIIFVSSTFIALLLR
jgi:protein translocase SecG subunit